MIQIARKMPFEKTKHIFTSYSLRIYLKKINLKKCMLKKIMTLKIKTKLSFNKYVLR